MSHCCQHQCHSQLYTSSQICQFEVWQQIQVYSGWFGAVHTAANSRGTCLSGTAYHIISSYHNINFWGASSKTPAPRPLNKQVSFSSAANVPADSVGSRMLAGKLLQMRGPATANDLSCMQFIHTTSSSVMYLSSFMLSAVNSCSSSWEHNCRYVCVILLKCSCLAICFKNCFLVV